MDRGWALPVNPSKHPKAGCCSTTVFARPPPVRYRLGLALLDLEEPWRVLRRSDVWILGPKAIYERIGDVSDVVFPSGVVVKKEIDQLNLYYGAADSSVAVASAKMSELMDYMMSCPEVHE